MAGDSSGDPISRRSPVRFLNHTVRLPEAPFMLALVSRAPLYIFFATRVAAQAIPLFGDQARGGHGPKPRPAPAEAVAAAQTYADHLEAQVRRSPLEWYHFQPFLGLLARPDPAESD